MSVSPDSLSQGLDDPSSRRALLEPQPPPFAKEVQPTYLWTVRGAKGGPVPVQTWGKGQPLQGSLEGSLAGSESRHGDSREDGKVAYVSLALPCSPM